MCPGGSARAALLLATLGAGRLGTGQWGWGSEGLEVPPGVGGAGGPRTRKVGNSQSCWVAGGWAPRRSRGTCSHPTPIGSQMVADLRHPAGVPGASDRFEGICERPNNAKLHVCL